MKIIVNRLIILLGCAVIISGLSCSDDGLEPLEPDTQVPPDTTSLPDPEGQEPPVSVGDVEFFNRELTDDNLILVNDASSNRVFVMNKEAELLHEWPLSNNIGNDVFLLPDGRLLASLEADEPKITFGGQGGKLQFVDKDGNIEWNFDYSSELAETHHDAELLPNGNVIALVWEKKSVEEAIAAGSNLDYPIYPEAIIEVDPSTDEIVWEWHAWDHLIQDFDDTKANFGVVADHPELINLNLVPEERGDIMHANGITYDPLNDLIYISVNFYHEVWVIDHSTTTAEAASSTGGNFGKGGDLIYRFGNPSAYDNPMGERLFYNNHYPNLLQGEHAGKMLIFVNKAEPELSRVYELQLPQSFNLLPNTDNEPEVVWSFSHPDLFSGKVSGAVLLPNDNVLITEGDFGIWEVTRAGEVVWQYHHPGFYWRAYHYNKDAPEISAIGITF